LWCDSGEVVTTFFDINFSPRRFAWEFPASPMKTLLKSTLGVRGLLSLVVFETLSICVRILNTDEKTVAYIHVKTQTVKADNKIFRTVRMEGVRGYENATRKLGQYLHRCGITDPAPPVYLFKEGVAAIDRRPLDYSSKFSIELKPTMSTRQAALAIFRQLLDAMRQNEAGIREDIDSEFLHDFRVAMRRTRSGLTQLKGVLPPKITETMKNELAYLGRVTGPTRDLDVYLLYEENYLSRLPGVLREGLAGFFTEMADRRHQEREKMIDALQSPRYRKIISGWQAYLDDDDEPSRHSERPVYKYARKIIYRRYDRIMKKGGAIGPSSPDEDLHRLRIQCKKLRYSLEFFSSLFPSKEIVRVVKQLKGLQNNLGDFNDLSVQQDMLQDYLTSIKPGASKELKLAAAIGGLLTALNHEQNDVRNRFIATFGKFSGSKNLKLFSKLFG
ncbi:MAG: CHAD domain-containing protein, partial [Thermodesulfobacteriota bacterium]|nr:CHAD domain-containing protein [Thermodesulfobacteriota bacterium]